MKNGGFLLRNMGSRLVNETGLVITIAFRSVLFNYSGLGKTLINENALRQGMIG